MARARIHIPSDASLDLNYWGENRRPPSFRATGFAAVVLIKEDDYAQGVTIARLPKPDSKIGRFVSLGPDSCQLSRACRIPEGTYNVYLAAENRVSVRLTLKGLPEGKVTIHPSLDVIGEISGPTETYLHSTPSASAELAIHGAAFSPELTGESNFVFSGFWFQGNKNGSAHVGDAGGCSYRGERASDPYAYAPGCPNGAEDGNFSWARAGDAVEYLQWGSKSNMGPGEFGVGNFAWHTGVHKQGFRGLWFEMEPVSE